MHAAQTDAVEQVRILGEVGSAVFAAWITRHARKLGLRGHLMAQSAEGVEILVAGPPDLLDALALACSLGPQEVWVEEIRRESRSAQGLHNLGPIFG